MLLVFFSLADESGPSLLPATVLLPVRVPGVGSAETGLVESFVGWAELSGLFEGGGSDEDPFGPAGCSEVGLADGGGRALPRFADLPGIDGGNRPCWLLPGSGVLGGPVDSEAGGGAVLPAGSMVVDDLLLS